MNQLKVEGKSQPSFYSSPSLEVKTENESLKNDKSLTGEASQWYVHPLLFFVITFRRRIQPDSPIVCSHYWN